jgi:hypothetical protein
MFKINTIEVKNCEGFIYFCVNFACDKDQLGTFRELNKYYKALVVPDTDALDKHWADTPPIDFEKDFVPTSDGSGLLEWKPSHKSPYDLGLIKSDNIRGIDAIRHNEDGTFQFSEYFTDCLVVRACILQVAEMKDQLELGLCTFGDYPDQAGCFRSGAILDDFALLLRTIDDYWD